MAARALVDAGFLVALLSRRDRHHRWAAARAAELPPPWSTCESVLSEAFHLLGQTGIAAVGALLERQAVIPAFDLRRESSRVVRLMQKYRDIPMSLADACLVRMTETSSDARLLTTDRDFLVYRRYGRDVIPVLMPD